MSHERLPCLRPRLGPSPPFRANATLTSALTAPSVSVHVVRSDEALHPDQSLACMPDGGVAISVMSVPLTSGSPHGPGSQVAPSGGVSTTCGPSMNVAVTSVSPPASTRVHVSSVQPLLHESVRARLS